jgi:2',3'-cyclic-nucleotide 2'-phosphodiesterase (5'-nucleotidase family)
MRFFNFDVKYSKFGIACFAFFLVIMLSLSNMSHAAPEAMELVILHTNDTHGHQFLG